MGFSPMITIGSVGQSDSQTSPIISENLQSSILGLCLFLDDLPDKLPILKKYRFFIMPNIFSLLRLEQISYSCNLTSQLEEVHLVALLRTNTLFSLEVNPMQFSPTPSAFPDA